MSRFLIRGALLIAALAVGSVAMGRLSASVRHQPAEASNATAPTVAPAVGDAARPPKTDENRAPTSTKIRATTNKRQQTQASAPSAPRRLAVRVRKGDTLARLLARAGVSAEESHAAIGALRKHYNPRDLRAGQKIDIVLAPRDAEGGLIGLTLTAAIDRDVAVARDGKTGFVAREIKKNLRRVPATAAGTIEDSLYLAARRAGMPPAILVEMIRAFSYDVDFQRDIHPGDAFEALYETLRFEDGSFAKHGRLLYAAMTLGGKKIGLYRYVARNGVSDFFHANGHSVRKALLRTPVDGARLTSRFGKRRHPILGYNRMHRGADFGAPRGTPVMAAGDGVVARANRHGAYGKYVRIRHNSTYATAYAHLKGFARGIRAGKRVKQGQIIGYVGSTGRSTGPHLHYEVLRGDRRVNPLSVKLPTGEKLKGKELRRFRLARTEIDRDFTALAARTRLASAK
ncbi:MAG: peptidoglycan DD-metalloendopeptidase family protein [Alphaproteobacteria bacterium]